MSHRTIESKLRKLIVVSAIVTSVLTAGFAYAYIRNVLQESIGNDQVMTTQRLMNTIDRSLQQRYSEIQVIAGAQLFADVIKGGGNEDAATRRLHDFAIKTGPWDSLYITDVTGKIVGTTDPTELGANARDDPTRKAAFTAGTSRVYYSDLVLTGEKNRPTILFAAPIHDEDAPMRPIIGTVIGQLTWNVITEILEESAAPGIVTTLLNRDGKLIASSDPDKNRQEILKTGITSSDLRKSMQTQSSEHLMLSSDDGFTNVRSLAAHSRQLGHLAYRGNNWGIVSEVPARTAFAPAGTTALKLAALTGALILIAFIIVLVILRRAVVRPITTLTQVASDIAGGNLATRASVTTSDELGTLARAFNKMSDKLQSTYAELADKATELRASLDASQQQNSKLENAKKSMLQILQDLGAEKAKVEGERNKAETILAGIGDGVFVIDKAGTIVLFNKEASHISGYTAKEAVGRPYDEILKFSVPDDDKAGDEFIHTALRGKHSAMSNHTTLRQKNGLELPVADSAAPIKTATGEVESVVVVFRDVTKERQVERAKDEFISLVSHQLRTPLTSIRLFAEMLAAGQVGKLQPEAADYVSKIELSTERMIHLVGDILNISRIELGRLKITPAQTDLADLISSRIDEILPVAVERKIAITFTPPAKPLPKVAVDPDLLGQVIHNLLTNTLRYTEVGKGKVKVKLSAGPSGYVLSVADNGIGIPADVQPRIFERFFRADNAVRAEGEGTGLGLYLIKMITEQAGGNVTFESREGKGTTFYVTIPTKGMTAKAGDKGLSE